MKPMTERRIPAEFAGKYGPWAMVTGAARGIGRAFCAELVDRGVMSSGTRGAMHGEVGQTQFLPKNILLFGVDGDGKPIEPGRRQRLAEVVAMYRATLPDLAEVNIP